ncbi:MAG: hypothetical protein U1A77_25115 [Pirellulales bacterium]
MLSARSRRASRCWVVVGLLAGMFLTASCTKADPEPPPASIPTIPPGRGAAGSAQSPQPGSPSSAPVEGVKDPRNPVPPPPAR